MEIFLIPQSWQIVILDILFSVGYQSLLKFGMHFSKLLWPSRFPLRNQLLFSFPFNTLSLLYTLTVLTMICHGNIFWFCLLVVLYVSSVYVGVSFLSLGKFFSCWRSHFWHWLGILFLHLCLHFKGLVLFMASHVSCMFPFWVFFQISCYLI